MFLFKKKFSCNSDTEIMKCIIETVHHDLHVSSEGHEEGCSYKTFTFFSTCINYQRKTNFRVYYDLVKNGEMANFVVMGVP